MPNLIIFTGSDSFYFEFLIDCLSSLSDDPVLNAVPFGILDGGLAEAQKTVIKSRYRVKHFVAVDAVISRYPAIDTMLTSKKERLLFAQSVLHHFVPPDFNYFMWMEADMWVQDGAYLRDLFDRIDTQEPDVVVFAPAAMRAYAEEYLPIASPRIVRKYGYEIIGNRCFMGGLNIRKTQSEFTLEYEACVLQIFELGGSHCFEELAANLSFYRNHNGLFIHDDTSGTTTEGRFGINASGQIVNPESGRPIGIVHVANFGPNDDRAFRYLAANIDTHQPNYISLYNKNSARFKPDWQR